jgi:meiotically up-regulated gene 157 (Mug157) protein
MERREFVGGLGAVAWGLTAGGGRLGLVGSTGSPQDFDSRRPPPGERRFTSPAIEQAIARTRSAIGDPELAWLFENCFPNTLDTTVDVGTRDGKPDTFVITGDIEAMWLRDSSAQVWPYLRFAGEDETLRRLLAGVIRRQTWCILIDPYANAFNKGPAESPWKDDLTEMKPELHERKWEVDSLCYPIRLAHGYWRATGDTAPFDAEWREAMRAVVRTFREQQRKEGKGPYKFQRVTGWQTDTVAGAGYGNPIRPVGLICSVFRPSDDATIYPFLIPSNHFAVVALRQLAELDAAVAGDARFEAECRALADEVAEALRTHAVVEHFGETMIPYEVDGFGNRLFMDDANVPSLLSLPYLGCCGPMDPLYRRTRAFVLSDRNPYFFRGTAGQGIGGPHVGLDMIWPLAVTMRALTSVDDREIAECLHTLRTTHAGTGFMHESFHKDDPSNFTRKWFAWANTLFGELILRIHDERPHLLRG